MFGNRAGALRQKVDPLGWLKDWVRRVGLEGWCGRYYGTYAAQVLDVADPLGRGRVRAICPAVGFDVAESVPPEWWALPCLPGASVVGGQRVGAFVLPPVGGNVWLTFQGGDPGLPVWMGGWLPAGATADPFVAATALRGGVQTASGHLIRWSDDPTDLHLTIARGDGAGAASPAFLSFDKDGNVTLSNGAGTNLYLNELTTEASLSVANAAGQTVAQFALMDGKATLVAGAASVSAQNGDLVLAGGNITLQASGQIVLDTGTIRLGGAAAMQPVPLGQGLAVALATHVHTSAAPGSPTTPVVGPPLLPGAQLSTSVFVK